MKEIDARNRACPAPVLMTREVIDNEKPEAVKVIVDNDASRQNVQRFLTSMAYTVSDEKIGEDYYVTGTCGPEDRTPVEAPSADPSMGTRESKILVMVSTDRIGYGDDSLGLKLMVNFIRTLPEFGPDLWRIVFVNNGVKLAIESAGVVDILEDLEKGGVKIMVCGTCLEHYGISAMKRVGETTNMLDIITAMQLANKVISM